MTKSRPTLGKSFKMAALSLAMAWPMASYADNIFARSQTAAEPDDVYFIAQIQVDDMEAFHQRYVPGTAQLLSQSKAIVLAATPSPTLIEGEWVSNWTVLMRFDDQADFDAFYEQSSYQQDLIPLRQAAASVNNIVLLPAFDPSAMGN